MMAATGPRDPKPLIDANLLPEIPEPDAGSQDTDEKSEFDRKKVAAPLKSSTSKEHVQERVKKQKALMHEHMILPDSKFLTTEVVSTMAYITKLYHRSKLWRKVIAELLCEDNIYFDFCTRALYIACSGPSMFEKTSHYYASYYVMVAYWNYSDCSDDFCLAIARTGVIGNLLLGLLENQTFIDLLRDGKNNGSKSDLQMTKQCSSVIYNVVRRSASRTVVLQMVPVSRILAALKPYSESFVEGIHMTLYWGALMTRALLFSEMKEEEKFSMMGTADKTVKLLFKGVEQCVKSKSKRRRYQGYMAYEFIEVMMALVLDDTFRGLIETYPELVPLLVKVINIDTHEPAYTDLSPEETCHEQETTINILYMLSSFTAEFKARILDDKSAPSCRETVERLAKHSPTKSTKTIAHDFSMFLTEESMETRAEKKRPKTATKRTDGGKQMPVASGRHVMLSYQHKYQKQVLRLKERIRSRGLNTWMDIDDMSNNLYEAMADAIEKSSVVVICYSSTYYESVNCKREAEYAAVCKVPMVFAKLEKNYHARGWLGLLEAGHTWHDLTKGDDAMERAIDEVTKQLMFVDPAAVAATANAPRKPVGDTMVESQGHTASKPLPAHVASNSIGCCKRERPSSAMRRLIINWHPEDTSSWLERNNITSDDLAKCTGKELVGMFDVRSESPEFFMKTMSKMCGGSFSNLSRLLIAWDELLQTFQSH